MYQKNTATKSHWLCVAMQHFASDEIFFKHEATTADFLQSSLAK